MGVVIDSSVLVAAERGDTRRTQLPEDPRAECASLVTRAVNAVSSDHAVTAPFRSRYGCLGDSEPGPAGAGEPRAYPRRARPARGQQITPPHPRPRRSRLSSPTPAI